MRRDWRKPSPPVWDGVPVQRCTVHKHRNLLAHAPERLHEEITADYSDMIYAATCEEIEARRKAFIRKWRLKHRAVADSLEEVGDRLFAFTRLPPSQWRSARTPTLSNVYTKSSSGGSKRRPCCHRRIPLPCCSGRCSPPARSTCARSMAGRRSPQSPLISRLTSQPETIPSCCRRSRHAKFQPHRGRHRLGAKKIVTTSGRNALRHTWSQNCLRAPNAAERRQWSLQAIGAIR